MSDKWYKSLITVAVIGLVLGTWGMFQRLYYGHLPMNYGSFVPWGLWVAFDLYFLGLTAGAFIITVMTYGLRMEVFAKLGPLSVFTLLVTLLCEFLIISMDLGHPFRVYRFLITPNLGSMLFWLVVFIAAMWAIYIPMFYFLMREHLVTCAGNVGQRGQGFCHFLSFGKSSYTEADRQKDQSRVWTLSLLSLPVGLLFFALHGALFAILHNRPIWTSAMTPLLFLMAALVSGGALITFLTCIFQPKKELVYPLARLIRFLLLVFLFMEAVQFFVGYQSKITGIVTSLNLVAFGPYWWAFWIVHILIGSIIPLFLLITRPKDYHMVAWACFLILITFLAVRLNYLIPDLAVYKLEGLQNTFFHQRLRTEYVPNLNEWLVSIWVISLGLLTFLLGTRWLPLLQAGRGEAEHV
jgi:protein NrfD